MDILKKLGTVNGVTQAMVDQVHALLLNFVEGRYEFENSAFLNAESYLTKASESKDFEAHDKYIDVQIIVSGQETIEVADREDSGFEITKPYVHDIVFMNGEVEKKEIQLKAGEFCVLYPKDSHKPGVNFDGQHKVQKIVIKIPV